VHDDCIKVCAAYAKWVRAGMRIKRFRVKGFGWAAQRAARSAQALPGWRGSVSTSTVMSS